MLTDHLSARDLAQPPDTIMVHQAQEVAAPTLTEHDRTDDV